MQTQLGELLDIGHVPPFDERRDCYSIHYSDSCFYPIWELVHWTDLTERLCDTHTTVEHVAVRTELLNFLGVE